MARHDLTQDELRIIRGVLADPAGVAELLDSIQYEACAGLLRFPDLVTDCTAHIFDGQNALYVLVYRSVARGAKGLENVFLDLSRRGKSVSYALPLAELFCHPVTRWNAARAIAQLKRFVAWQYRQEKARRKVAA